DECARARLLPVENICFLTFYENNMAVVSIIRTVDADDRTTGARHPVIRSDSSHGSRSSGQTAVPARSLAGRAAGPLASVLSASAFSTRAPHGVLRRRYDGDPGRRVAKYGERRVGALEALQREQARTE